MPNQWNINWLEREKFIALCKEFDGEIIIDDKHKTTSPITCNLGDYDDFKAFTHWLDKQPTEGPYNNLLAHHIYDEDADHIFEADFQLIRGQNHFEKTLTIGLKKSIGDAEGIHEYIREELGETDYQWQEDLYLTSTDCKNIIDTIKKPYLKNHAHINNFFDGNDDHWYAEAEIKYPLEKWGDYPSILQDSDDAVRDLASKAEDTFNNKLNNEIERLKGERP